MIDIKVIASGSSGNCTCLTTDKGEKILCDVGIPLKKILPELDYENPDYAIITHEHGDHAHIPAIKALLERGTQVYMTQGTRDALKLGSRHNLHTLKKGILEEFKLGSFKVWALGASHDANEPIVFQISDDDDRVLFATDTMHPPLWSCGYDKHTKIILETNFSESVLAESALDDSQRYRIWRNHISVERVQGYFKDRKKYDEMEQLKEVHLVHISTRHGDGAEFKNLIQEIIGDIPIYAH